MSNNNRRRRSILKGTHIPSGNGILDDSSNFTATLQAPASNIGVGSIGRKRVSFSHRQIKEFQTSTSLPSSPISNSNKTLRLGEAMDVTFGRNDANMTFGPLAQEDNSFTYANSTVIQELDMEESLLAENGIMDASNVTGKIPRTNKGRKRVSFGHKQIKEFQTSTSLPSSPMSNANKTLRLFDPMDITSGQSEMNMTFAALKNSNMNKALANGSTHQLDSTIFEEFDMEESSSEDEEKDIGNEQVPIPAVQPAIPLEPLPSGPSKLQTEPIINLASNHAPCEVLKVALLVDASSLPIEVHSLKRNKMFKTQPQPPRGAFFDVKTPKRLEVNQNSRDPISTSPIILSPFSKVNTRVPRRSLSLIESGEPTFPKAQIQTHPLSSQGSNAGVPILHEIQNDEQQNVSLPESGEPIPPKDNTFEIQLQPLSSLRSNIMEPILPMNHEIQNVSLPESGEPIPPKDNTFEIQHHPLSSPQSSNMEPIFPMNHEIQSDEQQNVSLPESSEPIPPKDSTFEIQLHPLSSPRSNIMEPILPMDHEIQSDEQQTVSLPESGEPIPPKDNTFEIQLHPLSSLRSNNMEPILSMDHEIQSEEQQNVSLPESGEPIHPKDNTFEIQYHPLSSPQSNNMEPILPMDHEIETDDQDPSASESNAGPILLHRVELQNLPLVSLRERSRSSPPQILLNVPLISPEMLIGNRTRCSIRPSPIEDRTQNSMNLSEELLDQQNNHMLNSTEILEGINEQFVPTFMPNENQLNLSIELYNYVSNSVQIHGMKRIKFCDRVRQEIIQLPINVYDTFKLTYHNCFVTGFWDSIESHRKNLVKLM